MRAGYDIIGDVHGQAGALARLCSKLGYDEWGQHPDRRQAVFVGDLNDKGPETGRVVTRVRAWVGAGHAYAVMGNHELNAIAWNVERRNGEGYLRAHTDANHGHHSTHLAEKQRDPQCYADDLAFFRTLPFWLDLGDLRVVHACWHEDSLNTFRKELREGRYLTDDALHAAYTDGTDMHAAVTTALKGPTLELPRGAWYEDSQGQTRRRARMRWWAEDGASVAELALLKGKPTEADLDAMRARSPEWRVSYLGKTPVFFGHYHLLGEPRVTAPNAVCTDWGAGSGRRLAAYRFSGGAVSDDKFVSVAV